MRGPSIRIKYDVRRRWVCPVCGLERFVAATETSVRCPCRSGEVQMELREPFRPARPAPPPLDLLITEADCDPDESPIERSQAPSEPATPPFAEDSGLEERGVDDGQDTEGTSS